MSTSRIIQIKRVFEALISEIFQASLLSYLVLYVLEDFIPGFVSKYLDINIMLGVVVASGVLTVLFRGWEEPQRDHKTKSSKWIWKNVVLIVVLSIAGGCLVFWRLKDLGAISAPIAILSGIIILLVSLLLLFEDENKES